MPPKASRHTHGRSEMKQRPALQRVVRRERKRLGRRLRELRIGLEWSQEQAAEGTGIHAKYLSRVETGDANPSFAVLVALSVAYGVPLSSLFKDTSGP